ncbi:hypothetical protein RVBP21_1600 [Pseudomonas phage BRkr]|nr:hypothetical protein RVBP21_1600 [Pseudomonas phage BRkr]
MSIFYRYASQPKTEIVWWNPISWIKRGWQELTTANASDGHTFFTALYFCSLLLSMWLIHILFVGWFRCLFIPRCWIGRVDQLKEGYIYDWGTYTKEARECILANSDSPHAIVKIVERVNPIFMADEGFCSIYSPNYKWKRSWRELFSRN